MGCCGCDNRSSANTAGVFALVQCIVGLILAIYNLNIFYGTCNNGGTASKAYLCFVLFDSLSTVRALLIVLTILYIVWGVSSIFLLIGNSNNRAGYVQQWVVISTIVIICDVLLPAILAGVTLSKILNRYEDNLYQDRYSTNIGSSMNLAQNYLVLLFTFSRGGLITWISDIALTVYTSRRASEIRNPPRTIVFNQAGVPGVVQAGYPTVMQGGYPGAVQGGYPCAVQGSYPGAVHQPQYFQNGAQYQTQQHYQPHSESNKLSNGQVYGQDPPPTYSSLSN